MQYRVQGTGYRVQGTWTRSVEGRIPVKDLEGRHTVQGTGYWVQGYAL